jgi:hypothetical protein
LSLAIELIRPALAQLEHELAAAVRYGAAGAARSLDRIPVTSETPM